MKKNVKRGEIYYADLSPVIGSEQDGIRPVLIISNDIGNKCSPTVMVAAITKKRNIGLPTHVLLKKNFGLSCQSIVMLEQLRTIDKRRLRDYVGQIDIGAMMEIDKALFISTGTYENIKKIYEDIKNPKK